MSIGAASRPWSADHAHELACGPVDGDSFVGKGRLLADSGQSANDSPYAQWTECVASQIAVHFGPCESRFGVLDREV